MWVIHFHHGVGLISLNYGFDSSNEFVLDSQVMIKVEVCIEKMQTHVVFEYVFDA